MNNQNLDQSHNRVPYSEALWHPDEVVSDPQLSADEKRALLAAWASDVRAVPDAPAMRQLDNGAVVSLATILAALKELDGGKAAGLKMGRYPDQRHDKILTRWRRRSPWQRWRRDDDDDPPPVPVALPAGNCIPAWS